MVGSCQVEPQVRHLTATSRRSRDGVLRAPAGFVIGAAASRILGRNQDQNLPQGYVPGPVALDAGGNVYADVNVHLGAASFPWNKWLIHDTFLGSLSVANLAVDQCQLRNIVTTRR
jgi:hypothetical protein